MMIMISTSFLFSFTIFFMLIFSSFSQTYSKPHNIIQETCKKSAESTPNLTYKFCVTSLESDRRSRSANLHKLGLISIDLLRHNVTSTRREIKKLLRNKKMEEFIKGCLKDCVELYSDAVPTLKEAKREYKNRNYKDSNIKVSSIMEAPTTCENGFKEKEGIVSPLTNNNSNVFQLAALTLSIINMNLHDIQ
uniref:Pectinesterase inhibitor domain-containing protein n=1 Tax=Cucumis melo TaxID=3656 RepID=A0A9I9DEM2_CUCME